MKKKLGNVYNGLLAWSKFSSIKIVATFTDKPFPLDASGTERNRSMLSIEAVLLMSEVFLFLEDPADEGFFLVLGDCSFE